MGSKLIMFVTVMSVVSDAVLDDGEDYQEEIEIYKIAIDFVDECGNKELFLCLKERALNYLDNHPNELYIGIKPTDRYSRKSTTEQLPDKPRAREHAVESILWDRVADYLSSHTIEFKVPPDTLQEMKKTIEEGRGKDGGGGNKGGGAWGLRMKEMLMLFQLKAAILGAIVLKLIGLVAFKALLVAKIALTISSIIALKKLLEPQHHGSTYEVIAAHPPHEEYAHYD